MNEGEPRKLVALVGSYRKQGAIDSAVDEILNEVERFGVETEKIYLLDQYIEFCTNCRECMQAAGDARGRCVIDDEMNPLLDRIGEADYLVLGAPVNMNNVNALTRKFMERCAGFGYWPWGEPIPKIRNKTLNKRSLLVSSSAAPAWMGRYLTAALSALKMLSKLLHAKPVGVLWIGKVNREDVALTAKQKKTAQKLARKLLRK
ncbi:flavodoxin family protein [Methylomarinum vadi]|uniref:flavodoxin family protein n=1 Tax=Methylomarinum vadi TaxID=438855 RepID=UPI0004DFC103|nr:flavodoxin family protein [Methylomarinum vadi]